MRRRPIELSRESMAAVVGIQRPLVVWRMAVFAFVSYAGAAALTVIESFNMRSGVAANRRLLCGGDTEDLRADHEFW